MATPLELVKKRKEEALNNISAKLYMAKKKVCVGMATCEIAAGSKEVMEVFENAIKNGLTQVYLSQKGCAGRCNLEPTVEIVEENKPTVKYCKVTPEKALEIVDRHLKRDEVIKEWQMDFGENNGK